MQGGAIVLSTFLIKTIFTPAVMLGGKADSLLGLVQINLQQGIAGLAVCYLVQVRRNTAPSPTPESAPCLGQMGFRHLPGNKRVPYISVKALRGACGRRRYTG